MASALPTIASMGLIRHGFHKLFPAIASSKQWGLWVGFVGFMAMGFGEEEKRGRFCLQERERLYIQWLKCWLCILYTHMVKMLYWKFIIFQLGKWCEALYSMVKMLATGYYQISWLFFTVEFLYTYMVHYFIIFHSERFELD